MSLQLEKYLKTIETGRGVHRHNLLQYLIGVQQIEGYVPAEAVRRLSGCLKVPAAQVRGLISFYTFLFSESRGEYRILFSDNITDRMAGNQSLMDRLCRALEISPHSFKTGQPVYVSTTSCTGLCDQGPALLVNEQAIARLDAERIDTIADLARQKIPLDQWPSSLFVIEQNVQRSDIMLACEAKTGDALQMALKESCEPFLEALERSGLRGRGGAGYPVFRKWRQCRDNPTEVKTVVCNADEGEPGTFKDRVLLARYASDVIEGMTICAAVTGAQQGFLYLRGEYRFLHDSLNELIDKRRGQGWLGKNITGVEGFNFDIDIHLGAGAYVCGEESAMLESLEGKRGIPRIRPPFPVDSGYLDTPNRG